MKFFKNRRVRIIASYKTLIINLITKLIIINFIIFFVIGNLKQITKFNLTKTNLIYFIMSIVISLVISYFIILVYSYFKQGRIKQLAHRQKLAIMK